MPALLRESLLRQNAIIIGDAAAAAASESGRAIIGQGNNW